VHHCARAPAVADEGQIADVNREKAQKGEQERKTGSVGPLGLWEKYRAEWSRMGAVYQHQYNINSISSTKLVVLTSKLF
jgi:hypothetical protein